MTDPWYPPNGVLSPSRHGTLVLRRVNIAKDANIPVEALWTALPALTKNETDWLTGFRRHRQAGFSGLLLTGTSPTLDPLSRLGAMCGFMNRNFVRARLFSLTEVIAGITDGDPLTATCLLIPDFVVEKKSDKKPLPSWRIQQLTALLTERWSTTGTQTVICAPSLAAIGDEYGSYVENLIKGHYIQMAVS